MIKKVTKLKNNFKHQCKMQTPNKLIPIKFHNTHMINMLIKNCMCHCLSK